MSFLITRGLGYVGEITSKIYITRDESYGGTGFIDRTTYEPKVTEKESKDMFTPTSKNLLNYYKGLVDDNKTMLSGIIYQNEDKLYQNNTYKVEIEKNLPSTTKIIIGEEYQYRIDKLVYDHYKNERYYWVILSHNNITDPFDLEVGRIIELPDVSVIDAAIKNAKQIIKLKRNNQNVNIVK